MSQVSHPTIPIRTQLRTTVRAHQVAWAAALLALLATVAVALVVAIDGGTSSTNAVPGRHAGVAVRSYGGPNEAAVAAAVGSRPSTGPSESNVAAAVGGGTSAPSSDGPNEAATASAISGR